MLESGRDQTDMSKLRILHSADLHLDSPFEGLSAGKAAIDGLPCEKPDKPVSEGTSISLRGSGKIKLVSVNGQTKKGRISVVIHRYV